MAVARCPKCGQEFTDYISYYKHIATCTGGEWTHKLEIGFVKLPWVSQANVESWVGTTLLVTVNPLITILGYTFVGKEVDWSKSVFRLYYRKTGLLCPIALAPILAVLGIALAAGICIIGLSWLEHETRLDTQFKTVAQWVDEGKLSAQDALNYQKEVEKAPTDLLGGLGGAVTTALGAGAGILILVLVLMMMRK